VLFNCRDVRAGYEEQLEELRQNAVSMWTLNDALPLIREISAIALRHGFSVALYGSLLDRGESEKDLDLFFVEQDPEICHVQGCLDEIRELPEIHHYTTHDCPSETIAVIWLQDHKHHIDVQFRRLSTR